MTLVACWILLPLVLGALALGCGLLLETIAGRRMPGVLLAPAGLALMIVAAQAAVTNDQTAELATPLVIALAVAGVALGAPGRVRSVDLWAVGAAAGVYAVFAAPVVLSGEATFAGYIKLDDTATWLAITDRVMDHGRSLEGLGPSTYEVTLQSYLTNGYPVGSFLPLGIAHTLTDQDSAWLFQPYIAFLAAMMALALYALAASVVRSPWLRARGRLRCGAAGDPLRLLALGRRQGDRRRMDPGDGRGAAGAGGAIGEGSAGAAGVDRSRGRVRRNARNSERRAARHGWHPRCCWRWES